MEVLVRSFRVKSISWLLPSCILGIILGLFVLGLGVFSGDLFNEESYLDVLIIAGYVTLGAIFFLYFILFINSLKLVVTVTDNGISSFDFYSAPCSLAWSNMKSAYETSILGFGYYVIVDEAERKVWIPKKLIGLEDLISILEGTLGETSDVTKVFKEFVKG